MKDKLTRFLSALFLALFFLTVALVAEEITLTTYYPAPYGKYEELETTGNTNLATTSGKVGIGTAASSNILSVGDNLNTLDPKTIALGNYTGHSSLMFGQDGAVNFGYIRWNYAANPANAYISFQAGNSQAIALAPAGGNVGIGTTIPSAKLHVDGNIKANLNGSIKAQPGAKDMWYLPSSKEIGFDIAELFDASEKVEVGDVVVIDSTDELKVRKSKIPYEKGVVGIVSSSPAILFEGSQLEIAPTPGGFTKGTKPPIALAGRILCKVSVENGAIERGDYLVSSSISGYAMKATDRDRAYGAIVGKALQPFDGGDQGENTGKIIALVVSR